ncbi:hypothetical protein AGLY_006559 [Aphis glycines]|uniref:Uncharacterized protein n=1 Tax=Aphis glycines TaxID=307491 RepID=A0A6G0TRW4_APHGL|nr:hypothetical protein AGLY_006559 [Aphis glycines]
MRQYVLTDYCMITIKEIIPNRFQVAMKNSRAVTYHIIPKSITSRNNVSISNFGGGFRWKSEYPWCIIEFKFLQNQSKTQKFAKFHELFRTYFHNHSCELRIIHVLLITNGKFSTNESAFRLLVKLVLQLFSVYIQGDFFIVEHSLFQKFLIVKKTTLRGVEWYGVTPQNSYKHKIIITTSCAPSNIVFSKLLVYQHLCLSVFNNTLPMRYRIKMSEDIKRNTRGVSFQQKVFFLLTSQTACINS